MQTLTHTKKLSEYGKVIGVFFCAFLTVAMFSGAMTPIAQANPGNTEHCVDHKSAEKVEANGEPAEADKVVTVDGEDVRVIVDGDEVNFEDDEGNPVEVEFCMKGATGAGGKETGDSGEVSWENGGGQTPDISYVVLYSVVGNTEDPQTLSCPFIADGENEWVFDDFSEQRLISDDHKDENPETEPLKEDLENGTYDIEIFTWDSYEDRDEADPDQKKEQSYLSLRDGNGDEIVKTGNTEDLEDGVVTASSTKLFEDVVVNEDVSELVGVHAFYTDADTPESHEFECVKMTKQEEEPEPEPDTATLRVCKALVDGNGDLITGSSTQNFSVDLDGPEWTEEPETIEFDGVLSYNNDFFGELDGDDVQCEERKVAPGTYTYGEESIDNLDDYDDPEYHDGFGGAADSLDDFAEFDSGDNSDGEINIAKDETRTLTVLNQLKGEVAGDNPGSVEITKYACDEGVEITHEDNGIGGTVPEGCVEQEGVQFRVTHEFEKRSNGGYNGSSTVATSSATDSSGVLTIDGLSTEGRYLFEELDENGDIVSDEEILYFACEDDTGGKEDNKEITFIDANQTDKCLVYNKADEDPTPPGDPTPGVCVAPLTLDDDTMENVTKGFERGDYEEKLWKVLGEEGYTDLNTKSEVNSEQTQTQLFQALKDSTTVNVTYIRHPEFQHAGNSNVVGYYEAGDSNSFKPLFEHNDHSDYSVTAGTNGATKSFTVSGDFGFAIDSETEDETDSYMVHSENDLNENNQDRVVVYRVADNEYIVAFEDLYNGETSDDDFEDMVIHIEIEDCEDDVVIPICTEAGQRWADNVVSFDQGDNVNGDDVIEERSDEDKALGEEDWDDHGDDDEPVDFVSLGFGGEIILEFDEIILDEDGNDLRLYETSWPVDPTEPAVDDYRERAEVYVSDSEDGDWTLLGTSTIDTKDDGDAVFEFDFDDAGVDSARFIKIVDVSDKDDFNGGEITDGFDLAGVEAINCGVDPDPEEGTIEGIKFEDENEDGEQGDGEGGLPGFEIIAYGEANLVAEFDVQADDENGTTTDVLEAGVDYLIVVEGEYNYDTSKSNSLADAEWSTRNGTDYVKKPEPVENYPDNILDLVTSENSNPDWGAYNDGHVYRLISDASGNDVSFWIEDTNYGDNSGHLTVRIYEVDGFTDTTDSNGTYSITVPLGNYEVVEVQQSDYVQTFPEDGVCEASIEIDGESVTCNFGNHELDGEGGGDDGGDGNDDDDDGGGTVLVARDDDGESVLSSNRVILQSTDSEPEVESASMELPLMPHTGAGGGTPNLFTLALAFLASLLIGVFGGTLYLRSEVTPEKS